ncbi:MAG TPA: hypothetical protein VEB40_06935 [Flavipsychrobacter sp.]|nr:hypothetical protein [Flavipsychrobacter sp.]
MRITGKRAELGGVYFINSLKAGFLLLFTMCSCRAPEPEIVYRPKGEVMLCSPGSDSLVADTSLQREVVRESGGLYR